MRYPPIVRQNWIKGPQGVWLNRLSKPLVIPKSPKSAANPHPKWAEASGPHSTASNRTKVFGSSRPLRGKRGAGDRLDTTRPLVFNGGQSTGATMGETSSRTSTETCRQDPRYHRYRAGYAVPESPECSTNRATRPQRARYNDETQEVRFNNGVPRYREGQEQHTERA